MNEVIAYYLKNAPKVFIENKKRLDKIMLMRGQGVNKPKPQAAELPKKSQPQKSPVK
jgi:hypothetical protein